MDLQFSQLILGPMQLVKQSKSKVVIIDGLDECEDPDIQAYIIQLIGRACDQRLPVCFLIASRPEPHIQNVFDTPFIRCHCRRLVLDEPFSPNDDICVFLQASFSDIRDKHRRIMQSVPTTWPSHTDISTLVERSSGQFIYAATVVKFVGERGHRPTERLKIILDIVLFLPRPQNRARKCLHNLRTFKLRRVNITLSPWTLDAICVALLVPSPQIQL
jgi:hypothetical protein